MKRKGKGKGKGKGEGERERVKGKAKEHIVMIFTRPRKVHRRTGWKHSQNTASWFHLWNAQEKGIAFWQTKLRAIITDSTMPLDCIARVITQHGEMTVYQRSSTPKLVPRSVLKSAWHEQQLQQDVLRSCGELLAAHSPRPNALTKLRKKNARELQGGDKEVFQGATGVASGDTHTRKPCLLVLWKLTNPQGSVWSLLFREIMTNTRRERIQFSYSLQFGA